MSDNLIDCHLSNFIACDISKDIKKNTKRATVRPIFKKDDMAKIESYRFVSLLKYFLKNVRKTFFRKSHELGEYFLSKFISAHHKFYSCNHLLIHLYEN